jgi:hypothetical protein
MTKFFTVFLVLTSGLCDGQSVRKCDVFQFAGTDSTKKEITLTQLFNSSGQLISETYNRFMKDPSERESDGSHFYFYEDDLLVKRTFIGENQDSTKLLCFYNDKKQLIREEYFTFERRLRKDVDKGRGRPGGCSITEEDYEQERTWAQTSEINYAYDNKGNKILYDATTLHFDDQNRYTWTYDSFGRILKYSSFDTNTLIWNEDYSYFTEGYKFTRTWYDYEGNPEHLKEKNWGYSAQCTYSFELDNNRRVIKETSATEKGETLYVERTIYNSKGQIERTIYYDNKGKPELTHIYAYN